jgi:Mannosyltransferase (PIG-V)
MRPHGEATRPGALLGTVLPAFVLTRALLLIAALVALHSLPLIPGDGAWRGSPATAWIAAFSRWDGKWYLAIAQQGYAYHEGLASSMNFAPGYPALIHVLGALVGRSDAETLLGIGIVVSNLALLIALVCLYALARRLEGQDVARRAVLWLVAIPSTFFLSAVYPESLFLALALGALLLALDGRWALAAAAAAAAAVVRNYGVLLVVPLAWEYLEQRQRRIGWSFAWLALVPMAFVAWQTYFWLLSGDPFATGHAAEQWGRRLTWPWEMFRYYLSIGYWQSFVRSGGATQDDRTVVDLLSTLLLGGLVILSWRLRRRSLGILATMLYLPMISTGGFIAIPRYGLEVFPAFLVLARLTADRRVFVPVLAVSSVLALVAMGWFAIGGWFT